MSIDLLYHKQVPVGVRTNCLRQLCRHCHVSICPALLSPHSFTLLRPYAVRIDKVFLALNSFYLSPCLPIGANFPTGSATNHIHSDCSILPVKKITIASVLSRTLKPMSSSYASLSPHQPPSKTFARSGSQKSTTTAQVYRASSLVLRPIFAMIQALERSSESRRCHQSEKKMAREWQRTWVPLNMSSAVPSHNTS